MDDTYSRVLAAIPEESTIDRERQAAGITQVIVAALLHAPKEYQARRLLRDRRGDGLDKEEPNG